MGAVSALQTSYQLVSNFIPRSTIATIVRDTVILEFAPTLVCIVLAGVVGSKIASELGNMRVSEQIDALEIMGINTKAYLVMPKIVAALIMIPLLVVVSAALGIWGGRLAGVMSGIIAPNIYDKGLIEGFKPYNVFFCPCKRLYVRVYHCQYFCILRILCKRRCAGNRALQYQGRGGELCGHIVCRLYSRRFVAG
jgi:ABC-type transport system involved in resistance to organic solvents, permease component